MLYVHPNFCSVTAAPIDKLFLVVALCEQLHCIAEMRAYLVETKSSEIDNPRHQLPDCLTTLPLFVFTWCEAFLKISRMCVG